jgi:cysteinyl-tRNA synthetase
MNDDLNTSIALSVLFELVRLASDLVEKSDVTAQTLDAVDDLFRRLGGHVLGIVKETYAQTGEDAYYKLCKTLEILIEQRNEAREEKDFARADAIRDKLSQIGILLEDKLGETVWRRK